MTSQRARVYALLRLDAEHATEGQGLVEYALIILLVAIACVGALTTLGDTMKTVLWDIIQNVLIPALGV
jgi:Flp pilus assembly pilin Flp